MTNLFATYLNASISGGVIILVGLLLRPVFRKVPRRILCIVWLLAAIRLLLPFSIESPFSLQPTYAPVEELILEQEFTPPEVLPDTDVVPLPSLPSQEIPDLPDTPSPAPEIPASTLNWGQVLSTVWVAGMAGIILYCLISYIVLKNRVRTAVSCEDGVLESEHISGAFLLGYLKPRIYLPTGLSRQDRDFILAHERIHIRRLDHWWKLTGVICVAIHWYNPVVWLGYALLCRDIEITCDERVIHPMNPEERKAYSLALLNSEKRRFGILECPVAFGEVDIRQRIRNVLSYHPYGYWLTTFAVALVVFVAFCFLTSPVTAQEQLPQVQAPVTQPIQPTETLPTEPTVPTTQPTQPTQPTETTQPTVPTQPPTTEPTQPAVTVVARGRDLATGKRTFQLTSDGTLTIYGAVAYSDGDASLWRQYRDLITRVVVQEGCKMISQDSFRDLDNLTEVYLCQSIELIGEYAFYSCSNLRYIQIPAGVKTIEDYAFSQCRALTRVDLPSDSQLNTIGIGAFSYTAITEFTAPEQLKTIGTVAFNYCWRLERLSLQGSVEHIGKNAFHNCTQLNYVVLGESIKEAFSIFADCGEIETVENYSRFPFEDFL